MKSNLFACLRVFGHRAAHGLVGCAVLLLPLAVDGATGDLDPLNAALVGTDVYATAVQPDGKTIIAGVFSSVLGVARTNIARLNGDGTLDPLFNPNASGAALGGAVLCVAVQADGKVLLGGYFTSLQPNGALAPTSRRYIARVNVDGTLDSSFDPSANNVVHGLAVQADGKVILCGQFASFHGTGLPQYRNCIARLNPDGTVDPGFNPSANQAVNSVAVQADGKVLLGGAFTALQPNGAPSPTSRGGIARVNADGTLDTGFDPNANSSVYSVAVQADGGVLLGGHFTTLQPNGAPAATLRTNIARLNADGTLDVSFDPNASADVFGMNLQANRLVFIGGYFRSLRPVGAPSSTPRNYVARLTADGLVDTTFNPNANGRVWSVSPQADGRVLLGGSFTTLQPNGAPSATARSLFAQLLNDPATQSLAVLNASVVTWTRGGSSPEVSYVTFELSINGGTTWTSLGTGVRVGTTANWQITDIGLPVSGQVRARGRTIAGVYNGSSGLVESVIPFSGLPTPEIGVSGNSVNITDGDGTPSVIDGTDFGAVNVAGATQVRTFAVTNTGAFNLSLGSVTIGGLHAAEFAVNQQPATLLGPNSGTTFQVTFNPGGGGLRSASLSFNNTDSDESPFIFSLQGTGLGPELAVLGNGANIADGDVSPTAADHTDFGLANITGGTVVRTFTITNSGVSNLTLGSIAVGGPHGADFTVTTTPAASVVPGGSTTFQVTFNPSAFGLRSATLSFTNNDSNRSPFNFNIQGSGVDAEIAVFGKNVNIVNGDNMPGVADDTDFGSVNLAANPPVSHSFLITNSGTANLTLGPITVGGTNAAEFGVILQPNPIVSIGGSTVFTVMFAPSGTGPRSAILSIPCNDSDEAPFTFSLQGVSIVSSNADLNGLTVNPGALTPVFATGTTSYTASVAFSDAFTVTAIRAELHATIRVQVNGGSYIALISGVASGALALNPGTNTVDVRVLAQDATLKIYRIFVAREAGNAGDLDPLSLVFVGNSVRATTMQPDGKLILAGQFTSVFGQPRANITRYGANGLWDGPFDPNANAAINSVAVQADGKILLGGSFTTLQPNSGAVTNRNRVARIHPDGTLDPSFDPNANSEVLVVALQPDGKVLLGGSFTTLQPNGGGVTNRNRIARLNPDGTLDPSFDPNANGDIQTVAVQADGKVLLGGNFTTLRPNGALSATPRNRIARLNADGTLDTGFNPNANSNVVCVALQADGKVLLGGEFTALQPNGAPSATPRNRLARLNANGTLDTGFNPNANALVRSVAVQADGKVLLGGGFTALQPNSAPSPTPRNYIARVNADGTLDAAFNPNPNNSVWSVAVQADGRVLVGGAFNAIQPDGYPLTSTRSLFARLINDPAPQVLTAQSVSQVSWLRSGSSPEVEAVTFELSINGGGTWTSLGNGVRVGVTSDWQRTGLTLPGSGQLRTRGRATGGFQSGSSTVIESVANYSALPVPEIAVSGNGSTIANGDSFPNVVRHTDFGSVDLTGSTVVRTFTITNSGSASLLLGPVTVGGSNAADFVVSVQPAATVAANSSTTLQVTFTPSAIGPRNASVSVANNDFDEAPFTFSIRGTGIAPEMLVRGNNVDIINGDGTPSTTDFTDVGNLNTVGGSVGRVFYISNHGSDVLLLGSVTVGGANPEDFAVIAQPAATVGINGSTMFSVSFDPSAVGVRRATLTFTNNDSDESPFTFTVQCTGTAPAISVSGNGATIANGDITPSAVDHTDFGSMAAASGTVTHSFTITNIGTANLYIGGVTFGGAHPADFYVSVPPAFAVGSNGSTTLQLTFNPTASGLRSAMLSFTNNDSEKNPFSFSLQGTGLNTAPTVAFAIPDLVASEDLFFSYPLALGTFADPDPGNVFTYAATGVPAWLTFTPATRTFSGTPANANVGVVDITVTATDNGSPPLAVSDTFRLTVSNANDRPTLANAIPDQGATEDAAFSFTIATNTFADMDVGDSFTYSATGVPAWLTFTPSTRTFSGTPANANVGVVDIVVTATDSGSPPLSMSDTFRITVTNANDAPTVANPIADQGATEDNLFFFVFPANTFADVDAGTSFTYSATGVPAWLTLVSGSGSRQFVGTPTNGSVGFVDITVTATDNGSPPLSVSDTFRLTVTNVNDAPIVANAIPDQGATEETAFSFTFAANTFADVDAGTVLTYSATRVPAWLTFTPATRSFSGTPANTNVGFADILVAATDNGSPPLTVYATFHLTVTNVNDAPIVANAIPDQGTTQYDAFRFTFAADTFFDVDPGNVFTYSATGVPAWLTFTPITGTLSGRPLNADVGFVDITVTATDSGSPPLSVSDTFRITVTNVNEAPFVANVIPDQSATVGTLFVFTVPTNTFADVDVGNVFTYSATGVPAWLTFAPATRTFSGTPANVGFVDIAVWVTDNGSPSMTMYDVFRITVTNVNDAPIVANVIPDQGATEDALFVYTFPANTFADVDVGNIFTYSATGVPAWLTFTPSTRAFSGTPANANVGFVDITVTATDNGSPRLSVSDVFRLTVTNVNDVPVFNKGADQSHPFGTTNALSIVAWATDIDDGDFSVTQALTFIVTNSNPGLFTTLPSLSANGTLTYTLNGSSGTATAGVALTDDATAGGPALSTPVQTFTITVNPPSIPTPPIIDPLSLRILGDGSFQFSFVNTNNVSFSVLATTDLSLPVGNWIVLGVATNSGDGLHRFTDSQAAQFPNRCYQLRSP